MTKTLRKDFARCSRNLVGAKSHIPRFKKKKVLEFSASSGELKEENKQ
jgi:hypothetical protein